MRPIEGQAEIQAQADRARAADMAQLTAESTLHDVLTPGLAARYAGTFDRHPGAAGPQGIHWCLCTPDTPTDGLGPDGHPAVGDGFLPARRFPRRMWASSDITFIAPIPVGAAIARVSRIRDVRDKIGGSGPLLFVSVDHQTWVDEALAVEETQTIVYRAAPATGVAAAAPPLAAPELWDWRREVVATPALLFRFSALTFNTHRIHYDLPYATCEEGYAGLVVHGPLMASLLLDLCDRNLGRDALATFQFRVVAPAFAGAHLTLLGRRAGDMLHLRVRTGEGHDHVIATATVRSRT